MDSVKDQPQVAWVAHGPGIPRAQKRSLGPYERLASPAWASDAYLAYATALGGLMWGWDLAFIGMTIGAFLVLWLLVKGVERFER